jgi:RpiB/LacA/LacB family sugar-phosphate isomerase
VCVALGSDHAEFEVKRDLAAFPVQEGHEVSDLGTDGPAPVGYPVYAEAVGNAVISGRAERGVLICGSGVGAGVAANKLPGIRAGLCQDSSAHQGRGARQPERARSRRACRRAARWGGSSCTSTSLPASPARYDTSGGSTRSAPWSGGMHQRAERSLAVATAGARSPWIVVRLARLARRWGG